MKVEISEKDYWIAKCDTAINWITCERLRLQKVYNNKSRWYRFWHDDSIKSWHWSYEAQRIVAEIRTALSLEHVGIVYVDYWKLNHIVYYSSQKSIEEENIDEEE